MKKTSQKYIKKWHGFTLVEMMVVMAIITILATMGVSGFTGHMKKIRDTDRKLDIAYLDSVVTDFRREHGNFPPSEADFLAEVSVATNGQMVRDPLNTGVSCITSATDSALTYCDYAYTVCDGGEGYLISAKFESKGEVERYTQVPGDSTEWSFNVGKCTAVPTYTPNSRTAGQSCRKKTDCESISVCVGPPSKVCRLKSEQNNGKDCDTVADCQTLKCNKSKLCEN